MANKGKIPADEKVRVVERYLNGELRFKKACKIAGVGTATLQRWTNRYKTEGVEGFQQTERPRVYPTELKESAVRDYLNGVGSLNDICKKYRIRSEHQLRCWIKVYNRHEEFKTLTGGSYMTKARRTTKKERKAITNECIASGNNYGEVAIKYNVSYQQVYTWVKKMQEHGDTGLDDRRGHHTPPHEPQTEEEKLKAEVEQLKKANYLLQMELDFRKKLEEVEGRGR